MRRVAEISRKTKETDVYVKIDLDGKGSGVIDTGIGFFDHMLDLFAKHGGFDLNVKVIGDIHIDFHHAVEDTGIVLGNAIREALGEKRGIKRYGTFYVPMMESLTRVSLDLSGRGHLLFNCIFEKEKVGNFDTELVEEFFFSVASNGGINMHMDLIRGTNVHHIVESFFKAFARALKEAAAVEGDDLPSTKGVI